jgi:hypothetical protein
MSDFRIGVIAGAVARNEAKQSDEAISVFGDCFALLAMTNVTFVKLIKNGKKDGRKGGIRQ